MTGLLAALQARRSYGPQLLQPPAPGAEALQQAAELALRAPDHQGLRPFRFVHVGADARAALGELFAQAAAARGRDAEQVEIARQRAHAGPGLLAVVARLRDDVPEVPVYEQWLSVGAGVMNLLNALHLMGFGAKVLGGGTARAPLVQRALCTEGECIACWVVCGTPAGTPDADLAPWPRDLLTDWSPGSI